MKGRDILKLIGSVAFPLVVGGISAYLIKDEINGWYAQIQKPVFNPPNWLFGPVWTLLYILMGVSYYMILQLKPGDARSRSLLVFYLQLGLNFFWSIIFFNLHKTDAALFEILLLWACILMMILMFRRLKSTAAWLQLPYLLWVSFATLLNAAVWMLNR